MFVADGDGGSLTSGHGQKSHTQGTETCSFSPGMNQSGHHGGPGLSETLSRNWLSHTGRGGVKGWGPMADVCSWLLDSTEFSGVVYSSVPGAGAEELGTQVSCNGDCVGRAGARHRWGILH